MVKRYLLILGVLLAGCGQYANPNDLAQINPESRVFVANKRLESAEATLDFKVQAKEITDERRNLMISEFAEELLKVIDFSVTPKSDYWMYGALLRVTGRWKQAEEVLREAVKVAPNQDRKINDTLKLALAETKNGKVEEGIKTASSVLDVPDQDAAPILPAVLYEIVPAAQGKGHDAELAELLKQAILCHQRVKVDLYSDSGKMFVATSRHHILKAEQKLVELGGTRV